MPRAWDREKKFPRDGAGRARGDGPLRRRHPRGMGRRGPRLRRARGRLRGNRRRRLRHGHDRVGEQPRGVESSRVMAIACKKRNFCKPLAQGEMLGAFALTEPHVGSDASAITTRAEREGAHYVLNGVKQFITSGKNADSRSCLRSPTRMRERKGISAFLGPTSTPGYVVARIEEKTGQRASDTAQIVLENCKVRQRPIGRRKAPAIASRSPTSIRAHQRRRAGDRRGESGAGGRASYARERKSMGKALIEHQAVNFRLADMATGVEAARQLTCTRRGCATPAALHQGSVDGEALRLRDRRAGLLGCDPDPRRLRLRTDFPSSACGATCA